MAQFNRNGFAYFRQISVVLSSITLAFAFLLVATLLTVSVNQRLGEVAALRALGSAAPADRGDAAVGIGAAGRRRRRCSRCRSAGCWRSCSIASSATMPGIPERVHFFVFEPRTLVLHLALLAATGACRRGLSGLARDPSADRGHAPPRDVSRLTPIVEGRGLTRTFPMPAGPVTALRDVSI